MSHARDNRWLVYTLLFLIWTAYTIVVSSTLILLYDQGRSATPLLFMMFVESAVLAVAAAPIAKLLANASVRASLVLITALISGGGLIQSLDLESPAYQIIGIVISTLAIAITRPLGMQLGVRLPARSAAGINAAVVTAAAMGYVRFIC